MKSKIYFGLAASCVLPAPAMAVDSFDCKKLSGRELRIYSALGAPSKKTSGVSVKVKKGAFVVNEHRALLIDQLKPEGELGGLIPYKQPQIFFGRYLIDGREKICTNQRHDDIFSPTEKSQHYSLRCLNDVDGDGQFETFRRYGELVSYDFRTGKTGVATGATQTDHSLAQPFKLVTIEGATPGKNDLAPVLQSTIRIIGVNKRTVTLQSSSYVISTLFGSNVRSEDNSAPSEKAEIPLVDGTNGLIGGTKISIKRASSGWEISAPDGFMNQAKLICGGTALDAGQLISVFSDGGFHTFVRNLELR